MNDEHIPLKSYIKRSKQHNAIIVTTQRLYKRTAVKQHKSIINKHEIFINKHEIFINEHEIFLNKHQTCTSQLCVIQNNNLSYGRWDVIMYIVQCTFVLAYDKTSVV